jgi:beta-lactamase class D
MHKIALALCVVIFFASCSTNNVTEDDSLKQYFDSAGVKGCFALFDNGQGRFTIYNLARYRDSAYPPGATFDILESLVAIQKGTVKDTGSVVQGSISLRAAFQTTGLINDEAFKDLAFSIGMDTLRKYVDSLQYGNRQLSKDSGAVRDDRLMLPADQQLGLIKKLYFGQLPFFGRTQGLVRDMMTTESNSSYKLAYKIGEVQYKDHVLGWVMGWVEENKHPYFFVLNFEAAEPNAGVKTIGVQLVKRILPTLGFFQGKK